MKYSCLTWNTAKRLKYVYDQVNLIQQTNPDILALQEVIISSDKKFKRLLASHYPYIASSFDLAPDTSVLTKKRMFGQIIASKFPLQPEDPNKLDIPWKERVLTVNIQLNGNEITMHTTHIPPDHKTDGLRLKHWRGFTIILVQQRINSTFSVVTSMHPKKKTLKEE